MTYTRWTSSGGELGSFVTVAVMGEFAANGAPPESSMRITYCRLP